MKILGNHVLKFTCAVGYTIVAILILPGLFIASPQAQIGPFFQVTADIQLGTGDGKLSDTKTVAANPGEKVVVEVFASGLSNTQGFEAIFQVDNPAAISAAVGSNQGGPFPFALPTNIKDGNINLSLGALSSSVTIAPGTPQFVGFLTLTLSQTDSKVTIKMIRANPGTGEILQNITLAVDNSGTTTIIPTNPIEAADFSGNGIVDFSDFLTFASQFNKKKGDADFITRIDLDQDGMVGFSDFLLFAAQFNKTWTPSNDTQATISVSPTSFDFETDRGAILLVRISNTSSGQLSGTITLTGVGFSITSGGGDYNLSSGESRDVYVRFTGTESTTYSGSLAISHNATNQSSPTIVSLSGSGTPLPTSRIISVSRNSIDFGTITVGQSSTESFTISNSSSSNDRLSGSISSSGSGFSITSGGGSFTLSSGQSRNITIQFSPTTGNAYSGSVSISHNATNQSSPTAVSLSGSGTPLPTSRIISVSRNSIDFGTITVGQSSTESFTISNSSSSNDRLSGSISSSGSGFSITSGGGSFTLSSGQSRNITVQFSPTGASAYSGSVSISHDATNQSSPTVVSLFGSGSPRTYNVSGIVQDGSGARLGNVTISFSGGFSSVMTASNGTWSKSGLSGTVTVTPSRSGYTFSPANRTVGGADTKVDFTGALNMTTVSLPVARRGYANHTSYGVYNAQQNADIYVGYEDLPFPLPNNTNRGFAFFALPLSIRNATIVSATLQVRVKTLSEWNSLLSSVNANHLGALSWDSFVTLSDETKWNRLAGVYAFPYQGRAATLNFPIAASQLSRLSQAEIGFSFIAVPEQPSGASGSQTNRIILNDPILIVTYR